MSDGMKSQSKFFNSIIDPPFSVGLHSHHPLTSSNIGATRTFTQGIYSIMREAKKTDGIKRGELSEEKVEASIEVCFAKGINHGNS